MLSRKLLVQTPARPTTRVFKKLVRSCCLRFEISQFIWSHHRAVTSGHWPCLLRPSLIGEIKGGVKGPHYCLKRVGQVSPVVWSTFHKSFISWAITGLLWAYKWTDSSCQWLSCMLTSEHTVNIYCKEGSSCPLIHNIPSHSTFHSIPYCLCRRCCMSILFV